MVETDHDSEFLRQVGDALAHLYDFSYLQRHPLAAFLVSPEVAVGRARGLELRRILLDAIDALKPGGLVPRCSPERRAHAILFGLYVEGRTQAEVANAQGISTRQLRRGRTAAVKELAALLRAQHRGSPVATAPEPLRLESQRLAFEREPVDLRELVQGVLPLLGDMARERGVDLLSQVTPDLPSPMANRTLVRQILIALASEALASPSLARLTFEACQSEAAVSVGLRLEYRPPEIWAEGSQSAVGEPHFRSAETLATALGGALRREQAGSTGEVLRLLLPLQGEVLVLVVDDNQELFALFERYVAGEPYRLVHAGGVDQALELARSLRPQVITVDLMMPARDGWELLQALHGDRAASGIPVIVCSVLEETQLTASLGAQGYLKKPVGQADLLAALRAATGRS